MRAPIILPILLSLSASTPADADFAMLPFDNANASPPQTAAEPPGSAEKMPKARGEPKPTAARGFGNQIPLSFAIRQIVPPPIKVRFAREVDRGALVDWRGGRAWPSVLRDAIRPLGLRVVARQGVVSITHR
jgi:hypothetical protein